MLTGGQMSVLCANSSECESRPRHRAVVCLFGAPDPVDTDRIYREQMLRDSLQFLARYQPITDSEVSEDRTTDDSGSSSCEDVVDNRMVVEEERHQESNPRHRVLRGRSTTQRQQTKLTEFYQTSRNYCKKPRKSADDA